jgi:hypothetical protein
MMISQQSQSLDPFYRDPRDINCPADIPAPRGRASVFAKQSIGFWSFDAGEAHPGIPLDELRGFDIETLEGWLSCILGVKCGQCYVPKLQQRQGWTTDSFWFQQYGKWLMFKPGLEEAVRRELVRKKSQRWKLVYMSVKTEPLLRIPDCQKVTCSILESFVKARRPVFLFVQTRMDPTRHQAYELMRELGRQRRIAFSISISTDDRKAMEGIETPVHSPEERLAFMRQLKEDGFFVSAAAAPLLPFTDKFAERIVEAAHHASVQEAHPPSCSGSATKKDVYEVILGTQRLYGYNSVGDLERKLVQQLSALAPEFTWGIANAGFVGSFYAALNHYGLWSEYKKTLTK